MESLSFEDLSVAVLLNTDSGSCSPEAVERMRTLLAEQHIEPVHMWCGVSKDLTAGFAEVASHEANVLIVLGGDGTIRSAAEQTYASDTYLIPLPGGTLNILPKALYGDAGWEEILTTILQGPTPKVVSGGKVEDNRFFVSAICGGPTLWTHAREAVREGNFIDVVKHGVIAAGNMFSQKVHYTYNDVEGETEAITITCPLVSSALKDDAKAFEVAIIDVKDATDIFGLASAAAFGSWRDANNVTTIPTPLVTVSSEEKVPIILDGEPIEVGTSVTIEFIPKVFTALVPTHEVLS